MRTEKNYFERAMDNFNHILQQQLLIGLRTENIRSEMKAYIDVQNAIQMDYIQRHMRDDIARQVYEQVKGDIEVDIRTNGFDAIDALGKKLKQLKI